VLNPVVITATATPLTFLAGVTGAVQSDNSLIIVAILAFLGQTVAVIVSAWLMQRNAMRSQQTAAVAAAHVAEVAEAARLAVISAQENAALAQTAALSAARELLASAQKVKDN